LPDEPNSVLEPELDQLVLGEHELMKGIEPSLRGIAGGYLKAFRDNLAELPEDFKLGRGSLGNFILIGAYLAHGKDMNNAIYAFRQICSIEGNVLPVSLDPFCHLGAVVGQEVVGQELIFGQAQITKRDLGQNGQPIDRVFLTSDLSHEAEPAEPYKPAANPFVLEEIRTADMIVYGPGSFFTSIIPHMLTEGIADAIAQRTEIPKVLIANLSESQETHGKNVAELLDCLSRAIEQTASARPFYQYVSHVLVGADMGNRPIYGQDKRYLPHGDLKRYQRRNVTVISTDHLESSWSRGHHDPAVVSELLMSITGSSS
jgi:uncharacterized cofD-like protein